MRALPFSKSTWKLFCLCPLLFWFVQEGGLQLPSGKPALIGIDTHDLWARHALRQFDLIEGMEYARFPESAELFRDAVLADPIAPEAQGAAQYEVKIQVDPQGAIIYPKWGDRHGYGPETWAGGTLDRVERLEEELRVCDLKTGRWEMTDWAEVDQYVFLADCLTEHAYQRIEFYYLYARSGKTTSYQFTRKNIDQMRDRIASRITRIEKADPAPRPGRHCDSLYGGPPCPLAGRDCPVMHDIAEQVLAPGGPPSAALTVQESAVKNALALLHGAVSVDTLTKPQADDAATVASILRQAEGHIMKTVKAWAKNQEATITIGDQQYGYRSTRRNIDKASALDIMISMGMPYEDVAKAISISESSIKKMPKKYQHIKDLLQESCVDEDSGNAQWGIIKGDNTD